jgi:glucose 1-dehydrogenase
LLEAERKRSAKRGFINLEPGSCARHSPYSPPFSGTPPVIAVLYSEENIMSNRLLEKRRAIVTGASSGIGEAIARSFAGAGASVIVNYRSSRDDAERIANEIRQAGGHALAVRADVSKSDNCSRLFETAQQELGGVDVVVANADLQRDAPFTDMTLDGWQKIIDVNLTGQFICAQEAVRCFRRQGLDSSRSPALGKIIFTDSVHQVIPWARHVNYASAKGGLMLLVQSMAKELAGEKIRVRGRLSYHGA